MCTSCMTTLHHQSRHDLLSCLPYRHKHFRIYFGNKFVLNGTRARRWTDLAEKDRRCTEFGGCRGEEATEKDKHKTTQTYKMFVSSPEKNQSLPHGPREGGEVWYANARLGYSCWAAKVWLRDEKRAHWVVYRVTTKSYRPIYEVQHILRFLQLQIGEPLDLFIFSV